jgi:PLP dependent protein
MIGSPGENIKKIRESLPVNVKLVAISKTKPAELILDAYKTGQKAFGENKALEMADKHEKLPADIEWHFVGHLQTNKVKYIAPFVHLIHSVDSLKLLQEINREGEKLNRKIGCLLQFHIASEESKFGLIPEEAENLLTSDEYKTFRNIRITGVMGMATFTENFDQVRQEFRKLKAIFGIFKQKFFHDSPEFKEISMGMSDDFRIAVEEGSTIVRIGSLIFGER